MLTSKTLAIAGAAAVLAGCSSVRELAGFKDPAVTVKSVRFVDADFTKVNLALDLDVHNPNNAGAQLRGYDYKLLVEGSPVVSGEQKTKTAIGANTNSTVSVPMTLEYDAVYSLYETLKNQKSFKYIADCGLKFDAPVVGTMTVPLKHEGVLPVVKPPAVSLDSYEVKKLGMTGADLLLNLHVSNPNAFSVLLNKMQYGLKVNGQEWANGVTRNALSIGEDGEATMALPVSLDFVKMGRTVFQSLSDKKPLDYDLSASLDVNTSSPLLKHAVVPVSKSGTFSLR